MNHRILNLGAGTQSSVLYLMMCRGDLPPAEVAIFADTEWEPAAVYEQLAWLETEGRGIVPIVKVSRGNIRQDAVEFMQHRASADGKRFASLPLHVLNPGGSKGKLQRQCTSEYKIEPIERYIRRTLLGLAHGQRVPKGVTVEQVFGISFDERTRMRSPRDAWSRFDYPLVDMKMRRQQVIEWAERHYPGRTFPRSACVGCPFRSNREWREMRDTRPAEWADAVAFDVEIRDRDRERQSSRKTLHAAPYLHRSCKPLATAPLDDDQHEWAFGMENECEGMCGV